MVFGRKLGVCRINTIDYKWLIITAGQKLDYINDNLTILFNFNLVHSIIFGLFR